MLKHIKLNRPTMAFAATFLAVALPTPQIFADIWTNIVNRSRTASVSNETYIHPGSDPYALEEAIWNSQPYDTIHVPSGTYSANLWIDHPLTIIADDGPTNTVLEGAIKLDDAAWGRGDRVAIRGFTLHDTISFQQSEAVFANLTLERCILANSGIDWDNWWDNEYLDGDTASGLLGNCSLSRCTVVDNVADELVLPLMVDCDCSVDTIVWNNRGADNDAQDPVFVNPANGDYRLRAASPYVVNGLATRGALDDAVSGFVISAEIVGAGALDRMTGIVESGGSMTFSIVGGSHPLDHFEVNGSAVVASGNTYTFTDVRSDATLTAVFVSNITLYVDARNGNDANDGFSKATAVATLQEAVNRAADGDRILVADGTYAPIFTSAKNIVIESENGYKTTIIDGGGTNRCVEVGYNGQFFFDLVVSTDTVLRGFTLKNGWAYRGGGALGGTVENCLIIGNTAYTEEPGYGAAYFYGEGGGAYGSTLRHCTVVGNVAEFWPGNEGEADPYTCGGEGGGAYGCTLENCIVWKNEGEVLADEANPIWLQDSCVGEDPEFVNFENGDYRLYASSVWVVGGVATVGCESEVVFTDKPDAPIWKSVSRGITTDGVHLSWCGEGTQAAYWVIYRSENEEYGYDQLAQVTVPEYLDNTAVQGAHYWYWIEGYNEIGRGDESELAEGWCVTKENLPKPYEANSPYYDQFLNWLQEYELVKLVEGLTEEDVATVATQSGIKGHPLWQDFVTGVDPTNAVAELKVSISFSNGMPCITWMPDLRDERDYKVLTTDRLDGGTWRTWDLTVDDGRFFKVEVSLPESAPEPRPYRGMRL